MKHLSNAVSVLRLALGLAVAFMGIMSLWPLAWWLFVSAALSDAVDGALARRLQAETALGSRLIVPPISCF